MPEISVIVPNYNHAKYLNQRIDSILNQTFRDFEIIILDDNSDDNSREIIDEYLKRYTHIRYYYNECNSGSTFKQWDFGVKKSTGDFIWIAESDDYADPCFLERSEKILSENPSLGMVYCDSKVIDELNNNEYIISGKKKVLHKEKWSADYINGGKEEIAGCLFWQNTINNASAVLFRKSKYIEAGCADHSMKYCGDWFLYIRMLLISDIAYISTPLNILRLHAGSSFHEYYKKSTFLSEVIRVYDYISSHINLNWKQKIIMTKFILAIVRRKILKGQFPEVMKIFKMFTKSK
jgi:glycosyltransferase involved in cell wall biosynthesis